MSTPVQTFSEAVSAPLIALVALDHSGDAESWTTLGVFSYHGALPLLEDMRDTLDEAAILQRAGELGYPIQGAGSGVPGRRFADEPFIQVFEKLILITQRGGRDV